MSTDTSADSVNRVGEEPEYPTDAGRNLPGQPEDPESPAEELAQEPAYGPVEEAVGEPVEELIEAPIGGSVEEYAPREAGGEDLVAEGPPAGEPVAEGLSAEEPAADGPVGTDDAGPTGSAALAPPFDDSYGYSYDEDPYARGDSAGTAAVTEESTVPAVQPSGGSPAPPPPPSKEEEDEEDDGMLRMSFMDHLEELRSRLIRMVAGIGVAFLVSLVFANDLWMIVSAPATDALTTLGVDPPRLAQITPMEAFNTVWIKLPILTAIFLSSPWIIYQIWAFIAPGLYPRERRWAVPFVVCSAGLFITGGLFAYFVAFRFGLTFLLGIGRELNIQPVVSITEYFDLFVNVMLGIGIVFELPVLIFFLTLLRVVTPGFLIRNTRYAILGIVILAAIITPTPDVVNLMIFSVPMIVLFFAGVFASYLLVLSREQRRFPWAKIMLYIIGALLLLVAVVTVAILRYGYYLVPQWPFLTR